MHNPKSELQVDDVYALKSLAGCAEQGLHCDYCNTGELPQHVRQDDVPLSVLLSVMPGTKLRFMLNDGTLETIELRIGDMLVFRGDRCHAGCQYDYWNVRIHAYIDSTCCPRVRNTTHPCV